MPLVDPLVAESKTAGSASSLAGRVGCGCPESLPAKFLSRPPTDATIVSE